MSSLRRTSWQEEEVESIGLSLEALQLLCWGCCLLPGFFLFLFLGACWTSRPVWGGRWPCWERGASCPAPLGPVPGVANTEFLTAAS